MKPGKIIDIDTLEEIGDHNGVYYYTVGQRKGFGVGGNRGPYFCVGKNIEHNLLYLTSIKNEHYLYSDSAYISGINWINDLPADSIEIGCNNIFENVTQLTGKFHGKPVNMTLLRYSKIVQNDANKITFIVVLFVLNIQKHKQDIPKNIATHAGIALTANGSNHQYAFISVKSEIEIQYKFPTKQPKLKIKPIKNAESLFLA